jgi:molecular chaperone DnaK (HSP70)
MMSGAAQGWSLAIDFGTTNTAAAMTDGGPAPQVLEIEGSRYFPSTVCRDESGQLLTGRAAVRQGAVFPDRAERVPKRALVAGAEVMLGGHPVPVTELVAAVLGRVYAEATRYHGGRPPAVVVLTHPARWGETQRGRLRDAAIKAGITDPVFVSEPVAAASWYARPAAGAVVAVFDLGGGTLDTAVLRVSGTRYEIAGAPGGNANLGGEDFDELLLGRVSGLARERDAAEWAGLFGMASARSRRDMALVRADVTTAKEALSEHTVFDLAVVGFAEEFRLTRPEFEALIGADVDEAVTEMRRTIAAAGVTPGELTGCHLTGGSSRIPLIAARLAAAIETAPQLRDDPKAVVALGALSVHPVTGPAPMGRPAADRLRPARPSPSARDQRLASDTIQRLSTADLAREFLRRARAGTARTARAASAGAGEFWRAFAAGMARAAAAVGALLGQVAAKTPAAIARVRSAVGRFPARRLARGADQVISAQRKRLRRPSRG